MRARRRWSQFAAVLLLYGAHVSFMQPGRPCAGHLVARRAMQPDEDMASLAQRQLKLALDRLDGEQRRLEMASVPLEMALEDLRNAKRERDEPNVQEAEKKVQEAEKKVQEAKKEVQEAEKKVQEAEKKVQEAKMDTQAGFGWVADGNATMFANELLASQALSLRDKIRYPNIDVNLAEELGMQIFPLSQFLNADETKPWLFVRNQTRLVWEEAVRGHRRVAVIGSPGIGKSFSIAYLLRLLMKEQKTVVFEARKWKAVYLFMPGDDGSYEVRTMDSTDWAPGKCSELKDPENYYVVDPDKAEDQYIYPARARTIVAPSPDPMHFGEWKKDDPLFLYMATWTLQEARCVLKYLRPDFSNKDVEERYYKFGGIVRHLKSARPYQIERARADVLGKTELLERIWRSGIIDQGGELKPAHLLFQIMPEKDFTTFAVECVSKEAADLLITTFEEKVHRYMAAFKDIDRSGFGKVWEKFAHRELCRGRMLYARPVDVEVPMFEVEFSKLDRRQVDGNLTDLFKQARKWRNKYLEPKDPFMPSIDSCTALKDGELICFQITTATQHPLDVNLLELAARESGVHKIILYWVVPKDDFREFVRQDTPIPSVELVQRVLAIDTPTNPFTHREMENRMREPNLSTLTEEDRKFLGNACNDTVRRYKVMKTFDFSDVKKMVNEVLRKGVKKGRNANEAWILRAAEAWDDILNRSRHATNAA
ncbi:unnamed protein product [Effrenium voratum]|nr:unnamed protein product [Effrenium voratum]